MGSNLATRNYRQFVSKSLLIKTKLIKAPINIKSFRSFFRLRRLIQPLILWHYSSSKKYFIKKTETSLGNEDILIKMY